MFTVLPFTIFLLAIAFLSNSSIVTAIPTFSFRGTGARPQSIWCRMTGGVSRCVDRPVRKRDLPRLIKERLDRRGAGDWCPFRVCGPSYIDTEPCPDDDNLKPIGQCSYKAGNNRVYTCLDGNMDTLPGNLACRHLGQKYCNVGPIHICMCSSKNMEQIIFKLENSLTPACRS